MSEPPATSTARTLVAALVGQGVWHAVLCPGSRSAPLAYAFAAAEEAGWLRLHVRADERAAAFLALGLTRGTDAAAAPVALVTTSGTAVANLHPAVLEAAHAGRPLVLVTADRPHELRGTGANQTTDQVGIFGRAVRWSADLPAGDGIDERAIEGLVARAVAAACGHRSGDPGPVHLDVGLREPLTPAGPWRPGARPSPRPRVVPRAVEPAVAVPLPPGRRTVVVAGDGAGGAARLVAEAGGWPLLAEPTSGARAGGCAVGPYRLLLEDHALGGAVERVVVLGRPTLSRPVSRLLARRDVEIVVVDPTGGSWTDVAGAAALVCPAVVPAIPGAADGAATAWLATWRRAAAAADAVIDAHLAAGPLDGLGVARAVAAASAPESDGAATLVLGASMAVRDVDLVLPPSPEEPSRILANRGLAGIDGTISTAAGVALAAAAPVRALIGDLTFLHDVGGLVRGSHEPEPDLQVVVVNDDGGAIFATLEHGASPWSGVFERVFGTPHGLDLAALAAACGARAERVDDVAGLVATLNRPVRGLGVVEVRVDRTDFRPRRAGLRDAVREAVRTAVGAAR